MPGPFTHIYVARRVADFLASDEVTQDFIRKIDGVLGDGQKLSPDLLAKLGAKRCAQAMKTWEKFTSVGAIGPDLFFFMQDYNKKWIPGDEIMLALSLLYYLDDLGILDDPFDSLLTILAAEVPDPWAKILRFIVNMHKLWRKFLEVWNATIGPIVEKAGQVVDDLTGGLLSTLGDAITQLKNELISLAEAEILTQGDTLSWFSLKMREGVDEQAYLWSDMLHYRRTSVVPALLINKASALLDSEDAASREHGEQLLAFGLGWVCHVGADVICHTFVNEQCGGPFRTHWQRHHLLENHIDAYNYECTRTGVLPADPFVAWQESYPSIADSALYFALQIPRDIEELPVDADPSTKQGDLRKPLPDDQAQRDKLLDTDGALPAWLADIISETLIEVYANPDEGGSSALHETLSEENVPHPQNLQGQTFAERLENDTSLITKWLNNLGVGALDIGIDKLRDTIAPSAAKSIPKGFPFPWEIRAMYRLMLSFFKRSYVSSMNIDRPQPPSLPGIPESHYDFGPPDFSGIDPDADPVSKTCGAIAAVLDFLFKTLTNVANLLYDIAKNVLSGLAMPAKDAIYYGIALPLWESTQQVRDVLVHLGYIMPGAEELYPNGDLKRANEIDHSLVTLGHSVDSSFAEALAAVGDVLGNLDTDPDLTNRGVRDVLGAPNPWLPVRPPPGSSAPPIGQAIFNDNVVEYLRPWGFPEKNNERDPQRAGNYIEGPMTTAGPYPTNTTPDQLFSLQGPVSNPARVKYQTAGCPRDTNKYNDAFVLHKTQDFGAHGYNGTNPLGDPVIFSTYLIGQLTCNPSNAIKSNFNLDADRGYGYLCWDWTRDFDSKLQPTDGRDNVYIPPKTWPEGSYASGRWAPDPAAKVGTRLSPNMHSSDVDITYYGRPKGCQEKESDEPRAPEVPR